MAFGYMRMIGVFAPTKPTKVVKATLGKKRKETRTMREIKFRGKRLDNGEWVYGYYVKMPHEYTGVMEDFIIESWHNGFGVCGNYEKHFVITETIGQFTGLKDKNGKEMCGEVGKNGGDIVEFYKFLGDFTYGEPPHIGKVIYQGGSFQIQYGNSKTWGIELAWHIEVIGNATDNPELLEVSK